MTTKVRENEIEDFKIGLYKCVSAFRELPMDLLTKTQCLGYKLGEYQDNWKVVGITKAALSCFKANGFLRKARMGIHRAHKVDRQTSYKEMIEKEMSVDDLWNYYLETNNTVLATSTENMRKNGFKDEIIYPIPAEMNLFRSMRIGFAYGSDEEKYLRKLCEENNI